MRIERAARYRDCPKCGYERAVGARVGSRMAYACGVCKARFWAPAVVVVVSGRVVSEKVRPLRRGSRLI